MSEEIEAGAELVRRFDDYASVRAAFWLKASDVTYRYLYIASEQVDDRNLDLAYGEVLRLTGEMRSPYLDPFRVKVVGGTTPLAQAAAVFNDRFPGPTGVRVGGETFGGISVDDVYIYPRPVPAPAGAA